MSTLGEKPDEEADGKATEEAAAKQAAQERAAHITLAATLSLFLLRVCEPG